MPFPKLQKMPLSFSTGVSVNVVCEFDDNGVSTFTEKSLSEKFPPSENYDLANLLKNKIPLEEVNSKILGGNKLTIHVVDTETKTEPETKTETPNNKD